MEEMQEKELNTLVNNFDNSAKDVSTVSSCLLQTSNANNWQDMVFDSTDKFIHNIEEEFRKEIAFLDFDRLVSRGKELMSMELLQLQTSVSEAVKQADEAIAFNEGFGL